MNTDDFKQALEAFGIRLSDFQMQQFESYYKRLVEVNQQFNLTAITEKQDVYLKHFYDSLTLAGYVKSLQSEELTLIDVGAGAGFPSLPLKIAFPNLKVTMIDSLNKRVKFLKEMVQLLGLDGVTVLHGRAEDYGQDSQMRESFDIATARAVARTSVLSEYTLPFVKIGGQLLVMKASTAEAELKDSKGALKVLGGQLKEQFDFDLPNGDPRVIQVIDKVQKTPKKYPRQAGLPSKKPLH
ncbi:16S rRNA (guanine(527)-N(7))-methyltransferase RsmG [Eupransor demetentiae]|uniref:Ribosomal RNA small subunit methyltransferase G n=1 Tax=Eupransor demetentiae TaxID=3109584 RepID=A0ABP0EMB6_9LACO|nr:16S rRNA G527 N7-methylase RsmG (former glucose-inhibited division protein B) (RsmG) [Lactobacillaceae bacterium LMG 33000]